MKEKCGVIYILTNPLKCQILYSALEELGGDVSSGNTLYQLEHKL